MRGDTLYWVLRGALNVVVWGGELIAEVDLPPAEPAVFVANHAGSMGPIAVTCSLPVRLHAWVVGDMVDRAKAGPYLQKDFVKPELHLPDRLAAPFSAALSKVTVALLQSIGSVPVWHDRELMQTYRISDQLLAEGRSLLVFPEDPTLPVNDRTGLRPFKSGFAHLGNLQYARSRRRLKFYPVAVHRSGRRVQVGQAVAHNPLTPPTTERRRITHMLEAIIAEMLATGGESFGVSLHETP